MGFIRFYGVKLYVIDKNGEVVLINGRIPPFIKMIKRGHMSDESFNDVFDEDFEQDFFQMDKLKEEKDVSDDELEVSDDNSAPQIANSPTLSSSVPIPTRRWVPPVEDYDLSEEEDKEVGSAEKWKEIYSGSQAEKIIIGRPKEIPRERRERYITSSSAPNQESSSSSEEDFPPVGEVPVLNTANSSQLKSATLSIPVSSSGRLATSRTNTQETRTPSQAFPTSAPVSLQRGVWAPENGGGFAMSFVPNSVLLQRPTLSSNAPENLPSAVDREVVRKAQGAVRGRETSSQRQGSSYHL
ncbi:MAG: hypothetical protein K0R63_981 [Rickettsiales bacterium]|jgi:hypothetical protein|nr:hypothetical protein [Rickettsiales bacterium]